MSSMESMLISLILASLCIFLTKWENSVYLIILIESISVIFMVSVFWKMTGMLMASLLLMVFLVSEALILLSCVLSNFSFSMSSLSTINFF